MSIQISEETQAMLEATRAFDAPAEFQVALANARPEMDELVMETMVPAQAISTTLVELRDLLVTVTSNASALAQKQYGPERVERFCSALRLLQSATLWFSEENKAGSYRARSVEETVAASRPWRGRIGAMGQAAFWSDPNLGAQFADANSTGTIDEEVSDLTTLNALVKTHRAKLEPYGLTEALVLEGRKLADEASGRDIAGILGIRNAQEAMELRNRILTYAVLLGHEARMKGINAFYDDPIKKERFEAKSVKSALRRLRPRRSTRAGTGDAPVGPVTVDTGDGGPFDK